LGAQITFILIPGQHKAAKKNDYRHDHEYELGLDFIDGVE
jgi:hypothetical protein